MFAALDKRVVPVVRIDTPFGGKLTFYGAIASRSILRNRHQRPGGRSGAGGIRLSGLSAIWVISHYARSRRYRHRICVCCRPRLSRS